MKGKGGLNRLRKKTSIAVISKAFTVTLNEPRDLALHIFMETRDADLPPSAGRSEYKITALHQLPEGVMSQAAMELTSTAPAPLHRPTPKLSLREG